MKTINLSSPEVLETSLATVQYSPIGDINDKTFVEVNKGIKERLEKAIKKIV